MENVNPLSGLGAAVSVAIGASTANVALPSGAKSISVVAVGSACSIRLGGSTVAATTSDHYLNSGERRDMLVRNGAAVRVPVQVTEQVPVFENIPLVDQSGQRIVDVVNGQQVPAVHRQPVMEDYTETVQVPARIERRATGTTTLSIKYSVLVPMLVKALQEMHADVDSRLRALEAKA